MQPYRLPMHAACLCTNELKACVTLPQATPLFTTGRSALHFSSSPLSPVLSATPFLQPFIGSICSHEKLWAALGT
jgi:hypothetical protein